ncbi:MAG: DUF4136 domain-containing protein [Myxococcaceae bacterium]|nr:DUF4136 domain-containing protein [Myxococcaceae bacterium]MCI0670833.1 DUF4136 domain-containing protein [Myxococcaceae bacterium]
MTTPHPNREATRRILLTAGLALALSACATVQVKRDYDPNADFSAYHSFAIRSGKVVNRTDPGVSDTLLNERVDAALKNTLKAHGLQENTESPDLYVTYVAGARERTEVESWGPEAYGGWGWGGWGPDGWWGPGYDEFWTRTYTEGTLIVDLVDARTKQLVWRAYSSEEVTPGKLAGPEGATFMQKVTDKVFETYPPEPKKHH